MEKLLVSAVALSVVACASMQPKQAWERPPEEVAEIEKKRAEEAPIESSPPPKEPTNEDVCRKMWSLIAADAEAKSKKGGISVPTDDDRSKFLKDCYARSGEEQKASPEKFACQRKCILDGQALADVETCRTNCP